jgi:hypothetical protein
MALSPEQREKLFNFLGYGNPNASFWFLGMEEAAAGTEESLTRNIQVRLQYDDGVMDLKEAHAPERLNYAYWNNGHKLPSTWLWMAKFVSGLKNSHTGDDSWPSDRTATRDYVRDYLGRSQGDTFLLDFLPLPKASANSWPSLYQDWFGFHDIEEYRQTILSARTALLRKAIESYRPKYLFAYGNYSKNRYPLYTKVVSGVDWQVVPLPSTRIHVGTLFGLFGSTRVIFAPFFGNGQLRNDEARRLIAYLRQTDSD